MPQLLLSFQQAQENRLPKLNLELLWPFFRIYFLSYITIHFTVAKEREKALKLSQLKSAASSLANSRAGTPAGSPAKGQKKAVSVAGPSTPSKKHILDQQQFDISGLNLNSDATECVEEPPKISMAREHLLEEAKRALRAEGDNGKKGVSIVVIGTHFRPDLNLAAYTKYFT